MPLVLIFLHSSYADGIGTILSYHSICNDKVLNVFQNPQIKVTFDSALWVEEAVQK